MLKRISLQLIFIFCSGILLSQDSIILNALKFRSIGPYRGGRSGAVCGDLKNKQVFYFGSTGGGVWKTRDGGNNWNNISDKFFGGSIGSVAVAPSDNNIVYVGTGENTLRGNVSEGNGIWKSEDAGKTWKYCGLPESRHITRVRIHPKNPDIAWAACTGHLFGENEERGVYKTTDGGKSWKRVLFSNKYAGAVDLILDPVNPNIIYASTWRVKRTPYSLESGGEGSGLWKSMDGGETWKNISRNKGLPKDTLGIIGIAISDNNSDRIYAIVESQTGGLFRSEDAGETWTKVNEQNEIRQRAWYFSKITADPQNENIIYACNVSFYKSSDGGKTFNEINTPHGDHHDFWIDPADPQRMIIADDGGAQISFDGARNWSTYYNQPTAQFYRVVTDTHFPYRIYGAQQDNSTVRIFSRTYGGNITQNDWESTAGFESGWLAPDPLNDDIVYGGNYMGFISRVNHRTGESRVVSVDPSSTIGWGADSLKYRFQWNFPIFFSPNNPKRLYAAGNVLFKTDNEGQSWEPLSPDLTRNDKARQKPSGGIITKDNTGVEYYCTIFYAFESKKEKDLLWTGSDDGLVHISRNAGGTWQNITPKGLPEWTMINAMEEDPFSNGSCILAATKYKSDDYSPYIYYTSDYGASWKLLTRGIDKNDFVRVVRCDPAVKGLWYAGTEHGLYITFDSGEHWQKYQVNLPVVPITDMCIRDNSLIVATQGRSFWILDDLNIIRQTTGHDITKKSWHLFAPSDAWRMSGYQGKQMNSGENPPNGVQVPFYISRKNDSLVYKIIFYDKENKVIKALSTKPGKKETQLNIEAGFNTYTWDMRYEGGEKIEGMVLWNGTPGGPKLAPGTYALKMFAGKDSQEVKYTVLADPNYNVSTPDIEAQTKFLLQVRDKFNDVQHGVLRIRDIRNQVNSVVQKLGDSCPKPMKDTAAYILKKLSQVEAELYQVKAKAFQDVLNYPVKLNDKLASVYNAAAAGVMPPSRQALEAYEALAAQADVYLARLKSIVDIDLKAFNDLARQNDIPVILLNKDQ
jgi:photosystem II stability/assembly factor-like uncharacterized protein